MPSNVHVVLAASSRLGGSGRGDRRGGTGERCVDEPPSTHRPGVEHGAGGERAAERVGHRVGGEAGLTVLGVPRHEPARDGGIVPEADPVRRPPVAGDRHPHPVARPGEEGVGIEAEAVDGAAPDPT